MVSKRRTQDDGDDLSLFLGVLPVNTEEKLDELGRVIPHWNSPVVREERTQARAVRRARRRKANDEEDGYSTDGSLPSSDRVDYESAIVKLSGDAEKIFEDVQSKEFKDPSLGIAKWFGQWRDKHSDTYQGAFGGLGMVSTWEFWTRMEMLGWDFIEVRYLTRTGTNTYYCNRIHDHWTLSIGTSRCTLIRTKCRQLMARMD